MKSLLLLPHRELHPLARLRAWHRLLVATALGLLAVALLSRELRETRLLAGWLTGAMAYLVVVWWGVGRLDAAQTRLRASSFDPGTAALTPQKPWPASNAGRTSAWRWPHSPQPGC